MKPIITFFASLITASLPCAAEVISSTVVAPGEDGGNYYRIPAVVKGSDGSLIAVYDWRGDYNNDINHNGAPTGRIKLMTKRSMDNGVTWSTQSELLPGFIGEHEHGDAALVVDPRDPDHIVCCMAIDACYMVDGGKIFVAHSTDNGETWGAPEEMNITNRPDWDNAFVASGKMLAMSNGDIMCVVMGRIGEVSELYALRSTDGGHTCEITGTTRAGNESKLAELPSGTLLMSIRNPGRHIFATSDDGGATWTQNYSTIAESGVNSAITSVKAPDGSDHLLLSIATAATQRAVLAVYESDNLKKWKRALILHDESAAYSDIIDIDDEHVGVFAEVADGTSTQYTLKFYLIDKSDIFPSDENVIDEVTVETASDALPEYFNMQGQRVDPGNAHQGVYVERQGDIVTKVSRR